jgi:hypothetical protein
MCTVVTLATIAIALGANSAIFSVINGILLKPLPYPDPDWRVFAHNCGELCARVSPSRNYTSAKLSWISSGTCSEGRAATPSDSPGI